MTEKNENEEKKELIGAVKTMKRWINEKLTK